MKGWFEIPGVQKGDRTLEEQLTGLPVDELAGGDILDVGCAEGLIAKHILEKAPGSNIADCVEGNERLRDIARRLLPSDRARVFLADLNDKDAVARLDLRPNYEAVLLLSILHKLYDPAHILRMAADKTAMRGDIIVIRLPSGPSVVNKFTKLELCDVRDELQGFDLEERPGPRGEWVGIFRRR